MLLDTVRSRPWLYHTAKRVQPLYVRAIAGQVWLMRAAVDRGGLHAWLHNPLGTATAEELSADAERCSAHGVWMESVHANRQADRSLPADLPAGVRGEFVSVARAWSGAGVVYRLKDATIWGADGAVVTCSRTLVGNLSPVMRTESRHHPIFRRPLIAAPRPLRGPIALATGPSAGNLSHWLFGVLPRLSLLGRLDPGFTSTARIMLPERTAPFQAECLARFGVPTEKIVTARPGMFVRSDDVWAPSFVNPAYVAPRWFLEDLRGRFADIRPATGSPRIYISRSAAPGRRIVNEPAVIEALQRRGFTTIRLEALSFREQVALFKGAREIVAPHGAGLGHLAFAADEARVVELFSPSYVNAMYWCLADEVGLSYRCCLGVGARPSPGVSLVRANIRVDVPHLMRMIGSPAGIEPVEQDSCS